MKKSVVIVGGGPAGLFCAYELIIKDPKIKVTILDKGRFASKRKCPMNMSNTECMNCNPCHILCGYGGAGTFSDGKLNFIPKLGKTDLFKFLGKSEAYDLIDYSEEIFTKFGMDSDIFPSNKDEAEKIQKDAIKKGVDLLLIKQKHLGSDKLPNYIENFTRYLIKKGVIIIDNANVTSINQPSLTKSYHITYEKDNKVDIICASSLVLAPGRSGAKWMQQIVDNFGFPYSSRSIEIGVRVEVRKEILEELCSIIYDPTFFIKTDSYDDEVRTFCTNPGGFVAKENYNGYICVNGHALKDIKSNNSNFAFISKVTLTEPSSNTRQYGESIAQIASVLGDGKPIIQRLGDLKTGKRSTWERISRGFIEPTLKDCVPGDLALVLPHRIISNVLEGLNKLNEVIPGVNNDETLLYGPEIKFFSNEVLTDKNMLARSKPDIYFIGDGAGKSGNIVSAACTGLIAARNILKKG